MGKNKSARKTRRDLRLKSACRILDQDKVSIREAAETVGMDPYKLEMHMNNGEKIQFLILLSN